VAIALFYASTPLVALRDELRPAIDRVTQGVGPRVRGPTPLLLSG
jgi:hypothetical protein